MKQVRDEAHRFAITFHRELRGKGMTASILDDVAGLGPVRKKALMKHFKSFKNLKAASLEDIKAAKVIPEEVAEELVRVLAQYNERKEEKEEQLAKADRADLAASERERRPRDAHGRESDRSLARRNGRGRCPTSSS